nr:hypothetical protein [Tanacetum cinerariifolium]
ALQPAEERRPAAPGYRCNNPECWDAPARRYAAPGPTAWLVAAGPGQRAATGLGASANRAALGGGY